jgi:hypothetical protein
MKKPRVRTESFAGELLPPATFRAFKRFFDLHYPDESQKAGLLVGVGPRFWRQLTQDELPMEEYVITCFVSPKGRRVLVLILQLEDAQCRLLLDMEAPSVRQILETAREAASLRVLFHRGSVRSAMLFDFQLPVDALDSVLNLQITEPPYLDWRDQAEDIFLLRTLLETDSDRLRVPDGKPIREITVTEFISSVCDETSALEALSA